MDAKGWICTALLLVGASGCITTSETAWIHAGKTTRDEIVERYGVPDLTVITQEGETVTYRGRSFFAPSTALNIPTAQVGPRGEIMTRMEPINPGLRSTAALERMPLRPLRLRYDGRGIVQEVLP